MRWLGVARRAFDMLCERATNRFAHGSLLAGKQTVQNRIVDSAAQMQAARLMALQAAWKMDIEGVAAARGDIEIIEVLWRPGVLHDVIDRALQARGALGDSTDLSPETMYRCARGARICDGPDEVPRRLGRPPDPPRRRTAGRRRAERAPPGSPPAGPARFAGLLSATTADD